MSRSMDAGMAWPRLCPGVQNKAVSEQDAARRASVMGVLKRYTKTKTLTTLLGKSVNPLAIICASFS